MKKSLARRLMAGVGVAVLAISMAGCGGGTDADPADDAGADGDAVSYKIGIIQQLEHVALDAATQGFEDQLVELLGDQVTFDYQNAQGEQTNCTTIATKFVSDDVDLIMANATASIQAASAATADIPIVGTSVTDYITAGVIDDNNAPGSNVTGVSDLAPVDEQIEILKTLCPDVKQVAILYCSAEPNSVFQAELAQGALDTADIPWKVYTAADSNEIQAVATLAAGECDVFYIPTDNTIANNMEIIKNICQPAGIPVICGEEGMCGVGGTATLSISYYELGKQAGRMAYEILVNGADPATTPIEYATEDITPKYNAESIDNLGLIVPEEYVAIQ